jgi:hypothetical protein
MDWKSIWRLYYYLPCLSFTLQSIKSRMKHFSICLALQISLFLLYSPLFQGWNFISCISISARVSVFTLQSIKSRLKRNLWLLSHYPNRCLLYSPLIRLKLIVHILELALHICFLLTVHYIKDWNWWNAYPLPVFYPVLSTVHYFKIETKQYKKGKFHNRFYSTVH